MRSTSTLRSLVAALLATGCTLGISLTDRGTAVSEIAQADVPPGCTLVGDVAIGIPPDAARPRTEEQLVILMRNKAGEMGATHVVVVSRVPRGEGGSAHYVGQGTAYRCDTSAATPPPSEPASTGDEAPPAE